MSGSKDCRAKLQATRIRKLQFGVLLTVALAVVGSLSGIVGCSKATQRYAPPTFPVRGKVFFPDGEVPVGATVEFQPKTNQFEMMAMGAVDAKGKFSLSIPFTDRMILGATQGPHEVTVRMPLGAARYSGVEFVLPKPFVVQPGDNEFTLTIPSMTQ
jgi:hypothetical protein